MNIKNEDQPDDLTEIEHQEDIEIEEVENNSAKKIKQLQAKLKDCEADKRTSLEELQRTKAEFLNARKRLEDQKSLDIERSSGDFIRKLLPLCDSFAMAMANQEQWQAVDEGWRKGVESIHSQLNSILRSYEVEAIDPLHATFDPNQHEAVSTIESSEHPSDTVVEVLQLGYKRKDEIIRPAKVTISN